MNVSLLRIFLIACIRMGPMMLASTARGIMYSATLGSVFLPEFSHMMDISVSIDFIISMQQLTPA